MIAALAATAAAVAPKTTTTTKPSLPPRDRHKQHGPIGLGFFVYMAQYDSKDVYSDDDDDDECPSVLSNVTAVVRPKLSPMNCISG